MAADRTRVGVMIHGVPQFYQRGREEKRGDKFVAVPFFVVNVNEAATMNEAAAKVFVARLRSLGANPWIEDVKDGRRIDAAHELQQSDEDTRTAVAASIDDLNFYVVKPICRPDGQKWFMRIDPPGIAPQVIYGDDPLGVLRRAEDMGFLNYAVKHERQPQPQQSPVQNSAGVVRRRPGDLR